MVFAEALLVDGERALHQRLGLSQAVGVLQQLRQIVEVAGDVGVVLAEALLVDRERVLEKRFCICITRQLDRHHACRVEVRCIVRLQLYRLGEIVVGLGVVNSTFGELP